MVEVKVAAAAVVVAAAAVVDVAEVALLAVVVAAAVCGDAAAAAEFVRCPLRRCRPFQEFPAFSETRSAASTAATFGDCLSSVPLWSCGLLTSENFSI